MPRSQLAALDRFHSRVVAIADWLVTNRVTALSIGLPVVVVVLVAINWFVLLEFPNSGDEYAYLYQAWTLADGRLWNTAPPSNEFFTFNYIVFDGSRAFGSFPPGWPLAIAGALAIGLPAWLVNPVLGAASLALTAWLGARLYSPRAGALGAIGVGVSPFFLFNGASYFSHTFCGALLLGAGCLASRTDRKQVWVPLGVGFLIGWAILARYVTGAVLAIPIVMWLLRPDEHVPGAAAGWWRWRQLALVVAGVLPWVGILAWHNNAMTGSPLEITTLPDTWSRWFRSGWYYRGVDILLSHLQRYATWTPPLLVALYGYYLRAAPSETRRGWLDWMPVFIVTALYPFIERGGNQYGPRLHSEVFPFLVLFVVGNVFRTGPFELASVGQRRAFGLFAASLLTVPILFVMHSVIERRVIEERMDPYRSVSRSELQNAVVYMSGRVGTVRSIAVEDLTRNGIHYTGSVLYGLDQSHDADCRLAVRLGRTAYRYLWDSERARSSLTRMTCQQP